MQKCPPPAFELTTPRIVLGLEAGTKGSGRCFPGASFDRKQRSDLPLNSAPRLDPPKSVLHHALFYGLMPNDTQASHPPHRARRDGLAPPTNTCRTRPRRGGQRTVAIPPWPPSTSGNNTTTIRHQGSARPRQRARAARTAAPSRLRPGTNSTATHRETFHSE